MSFEKTVEGIVAIFVIVVFMTMIIPALVEATGITIPLLGFSLFLMIVGIIFAVIKSWMD